MREKDSLGPVRPPAVASYTEQEGSQMVSGRAGEIRELGGGTGLGPRSVVCLRKCVFLFFFITVCASVFCLCL